MPLRVSLVMVIGLLTALGLTVFGVAVTTTLQNVMVQQIDDQLTNATNTWAHQTIDSGYQQPQQQTSVPGDDGPKRPPSEFYVRVVDGDYSVESFNSVLDSLPEVSSLTQPGQPRTVPARAGSADLSSWRAASVQNTDGTVTIVALPLADVEHTVARLVFFQLMLGIALLAGVMALSMYIVRRALKPLN